VRLPLRAAGYEIVGGSPPAFHAFLLQETRKWTELVDRAGLRNR
jgi:hypothetical protein